MPDIDQRRAVCSFSGGKDSCLALWLARRQGYQIDRLLTMFDEAGERSRSHAIPIALMHQQAAALGCEMQIRRTTWKTYEQEFIGALREFRSEGYAAAVFGDIDLDEHREWEEKVCAAADMQAILPLWQNDRLQLVDEVLAAGFQATVVCIDSRYLRDEFCGLPYDARFIANLPPGVDACGENGEFHTFVHAGPCFREPVQHRIEGFADYTAPAEYGSVRYRFARLACA